MPLYIVKPELDELPIFYFTLPIPCNSQLEDFCKNTYLMGYSLLDYLKKAKNSIDEKSLPKQNQILTYVLKKEEEEVEFIVADCQLPTNENSLHNRNYLKYRKNNIFKEEKKILAKFYKKIIKTAITKNFLNISIPIIISNNADSQHYIDFARQAVRKYINNCFEEITVYLLLTDYNNDYYSNEEKEKEKQKSILSNLSSYFTNKITKKTRKNELLCFNEIQYRDYLLSDKDTEYEYNDYSLDEEKKLKKEKAEWDKLRRKKKTKSTLKESDSIDKIISERLNIKNETFSEMVIRIIEEKGLNHVSCYKNANVCRNIFSKITKDAYKDDNKKGERFIYHPEKKIALAFAVALRLKPSETEELLHKAGFSFANSPLDIIVNVFLENGIYDIDLINQQLLKHDQPLLGSTTLDKD